MLEKLLNEKKCFKLVLGAGNEDIENIKTLVEIYSKAGCKFFDLPMNPKAAEVAKTACPDGIFCFSYGIKDDPHTRKALINSEKCIKCKICEKVCIQNAIENFKVNEKKCIGCMKCFESCANSAITAFSKPKNLTEVLPEILKFNPDCIELHASNADETDVLEKWNYIQSNYTGIMSLCIDRSCIGDTKIIERIKNLIKNRKPYSTIIQADGNPMSGGKNDFRTTLQAVAMAEAVQKANLPVYILLSGGTNSKTKELANLCEIDINGISVGSYARKIVKDSIQAKDFSTAIEIANKLIISCL